jgi:hypothetical protein
MSSPEEVAEGVRGPARFIYFGINPEIGSYVAPSNYGGYSNLDPWPMYKLTQYTKASEEAGTAHFLTIQVSDGTTPPVDRNANRLANNLGPPMGHPAFLHEFDRKLAPEFILLRCVQCAIARSAHARPHAPNVFRWSCLLTCPMPLSQNLGRVMQTPDGKLAIEGFVKGTEEAYGAGLASKNRSPAAPWSAHAHLPSALFLS